MGETDSRRKHSLNVMRDWIEKNPNIRKFRYDSTYLLKILRAAKFNIPRAQIVLERLLYALGSCKHFCAINLEDPVFQDLQDRGFAFRLPDKDIHGRYVLCYRFGAFDYTKNSLHLIFWTMSAINQLLLEREEAQIYGLVSIIDCSAVTIQHLASVNMPDIINFLTLRLVEDHYFKNS